jgi:acetate kinase
MGMSPQTGLPHNNRVGDFDPFAIPIVMQQTGMSLSQVLHELSEKSGLLGLSGMSGDVRDLEQAAEQGQGHAKLALDVFVYEIRRHLGGMLIELGGADAIVFTGGIGENSKYVRSGVCANLKDLGIHLDDTANESVSGECRIDATDSRTELWVIPTNEELIVARQAQQLLAG